jgi:hypothetical protein
VISKIETKPTWKFGSQVGVHGECRLPSCKELFQETCGLE